MIIDGIRTYLLDFPLLAGKKINVDYLGEKPFKYAVFSSGGDTILKRYTNGDTLREFCFSVRIRSEYGRDITQNTYLNNFCESLSDWFDEQTTVGSFPAIGTKKSVQTIEALSSSMLKSSNVADCIYEIKCRIVYYMKK